MSADMPGQNTEASARAVIIDMPWWAACSVLSTSPWSEGGTITLSLYRIIVLAYVIRSCCKSLTLIINQTLSTGIFPDSLKVAKVIPLYKKVIKLYSIIIAQFLYCLQSLKN